MAVHMTKVYLSTSWLFSSLIRTCFSALVFWLSVSSWMRDSRQTTWQQITIRSSLSNKPSHYIKTGTQNHPTIIPSHREDAFLNSKHLKSHSHPKLSCLSSFMVMSNGLAYCAYELEFLRMQAI